MEDLKHIFGQVLNRVNILECDIKSVRADNVLIRKELDAIHKLQQPQSVLKAFSGLFCSNGSATNTVSSWESSPQICRRQQSFFKRPRGKSLDYTPDRKVFYPRYLLDKPVIAWEQRPSGSIEDDANDDKGTMRKRSFSTTNIPVIVSDDSKARRQSVIGIGKLERSNKVLDASLITSKAKSASKKNLCDFSKLFERRKSCHMNSDDCASYGEMQTWAESFDALMNADRGRRLFREFLRSEYSEENLLFWLACEDLHEESNPHGVEEKTREIYHDYVSSTSSHEISLDSRTKEAVHQNMKIPRCTTLDAAQEHIYNLMRSDSFPRFVNSSFFRAELKKASQNY